MSKIVISHRREDLPVETRRIRDGIAARLAPTEVVLADAAATPRVEPGPGDLLLAVIGPRWLELMQGNAARGERDDVRAVVANALRRGIAVVPVRVGRSDALPALPHAHDLPDDLKALAQLGAYPVATDRLDIDTLALAQIIQPVPIAAVRERLPGNSMLKMWVWAAGVMAATVVFANLLAYLTGATGRPTLTQPAGLTRPSGGFATWTGEGRIRRAIEAALAKGRRPEEARRCQSALITATDTGTIQFETASAELDQRSHQTLDALARIIKDCPDFIVEVEGHTDSAGEPVANQRLSERRAGAVRDYLVRAGVSAGSLTAVGYGEARPVAPNDTPANMSRNRRIEFNISAR